MHRFTLLLASNTHAAKHLTEVRKRLDTHFDYPLTWSGTHESLAFGASDASHPTYLNAVCQGQTSMDLNTFTAWLKQLETEMGRLRGSAAKGEVTIDLDVIVWDDAVLRPEEATRDYYLACIADLPDQD